VKDGSPTRSVVSGVQRTRGYIVTLFRDLERLLNNPNLTQEDIDRSLEGFLTGLEGSRLKLTIQDILERNKWKIQFDSLNAKFSTAAGLWKSQLDRVRQRVGDRVEFDTDISEILRSTNVSVSTVNGVVHVEKFSEKTIEVPVQDVRTKKLIHSLATQMKKFTSKYPKLRD